MSAPVRIQLSRAKGYRMPVNTVSVARPGRWGNPYRMSEWLPLDLCLTLFGETVRGCWSPSHIAHLNDAQAAEVYAAHCAWQKRIGGHLAELARSELRGKNLACFCPLDQLCHADILLRLANA